MNGTIGGHLTGPALASIRFNVVVISHSSVSVVVTFNHVPNNKPLFTTIR